MDDLSALTGLAPLWWHWVVLGMVLMLAELAMASFFVIWFGLGALLVGLMLSVVPEASLALQLSAWIAASLAMVWLWFRVWRPGRLSNRTGTAESALGEIGLLTADVRPFEPGEVRFQRPVLGSDLWTCRAETGLRAGQRVRVKAVEGQTLLVEAESRLVNNLEGSHNG